jgi:hypothetical protein
MKFDLLIIPRKKSELEYPNNMFGAHKINAVKKLVNYVQYISKIFGKIKDWKKWAESDMK